MKPRRSEPSTPLRNGITAAALAFVLPVIVGAARGTMSGTDFAITVALTVAAFLVVYASTVAADRRQTHHSADRPTRG